MPLDTVIKSIPDNRGKDVVPEGDKACANLFADRNRFGISLILEVTERIGVFKQVIGAVVDAAGDLVILDTGSGADPYSLTGRFILDEAIGLSRELDKTAGAVMVWNGNTRERQDYTAEFGTYARQRGLAVFEITTV